MTDISRRNKKKRVLALLLALAMVLSIIMPGGRGSFFVAHAEEETVASETDAVAADVSSATDAAEDVEEAVYSPGTLQYVGEDYVVNASYSEEAQIPDGSYLEVSKLSAGSGDYNDALSSAADTLGMTLDSNVQGFFLDIKIIDPEGNIIEPSTSVNIDISFNEAIDVFDVDDVSAVHIHDEGTVEELSIDVDNTNENEIDGVSFDASSFSVFGVIFTVDFEYNGFYYSLAGESEIYISELMSILGIDEDVSEIKDVVFSNPEYVEVVYEENDWKLISKLPFTSNETLTISFNDGYVYVISVTDAQTISDLTEYLKDASIDAPKNNEGAYIVFPDEQYTINLKFEEISEAQFPTDSSSMSYGLPNGLNADNQSGTFEIDVYKGEDKYIVQGNTYLIENGVVTVHFNESDPNFSHLNSSAHANYNFNILGSFDEGVDRINFNSKISKNIVVDTSNSVKASKSAIFDKSQNRILYNVAIKSEGNSTNVRVIDELSGTGISLDPSSISATSSTGASVDMTGSAMGNMIDYTIASMKNNEIVTFSYSAYVTPSDITNVGGKYTTLAGNTVSVSDEKNPEPVTTHVNTTCDYTPSISKSNGKVGSDGKTLSWEITANPDAIVSMAGTSITDSIPAASQSLMKYSGDGITVEVYDSDGNNVRNDIVSWNGMDEASASLWKYSIPSSDAGHAYKYVIKYTTEVDTTGQTSQVNVSNDVSTNAGKTSSGSATVTPAGGTVEVYKNVENVDMENKEITWNISFNVPAAGLEKAVITDTVPSQWIDSKQSRAFEDVIPGSIEVNGMVSGETYDISQENNQDNHKTSIRFFTDSSKNTEGLQSTEGGRSINISLKTKIDESWLEESKIKSYLIDHKNAVDLSLKNENKHADVDAKVTLPELQKTGKENGFRNEDGVKLPIYRYEITISGVNSDINVIEDTYDTTILEPYEVDPNPGDPSVYYIFGGDQYYQGNRGSAQCSHLYTSTGIKFTTSSESLPLKGEDYYPAYKLVYYLTVKDATALKKLQSLAVAKGGVCDISNEASCDGISAIVDIPFEYKAINKEILTTDNELSKTDADIFADYRITFNSDEALMNGGNMLKMTDTVSNLSVLYNSINAEPADGVTWDMNGDVLTFNIPDATKVVITYRARVKIGNTEEGKTYDIDIDNLAEMGNYKSSVHRTAHYKNGGHGTAPVPVIHLLKYEGGNMTKRLEGAKFALLDDNKDPIVDKNGVEVTFISKPDGLIDVYGDMDINGWVIEPDTVYYLREIEAPPGYMLSDFDYQFTVSEDGSTDYKNYIYHNGDTLSAKNYLGADVKVSKEWSDGNKNHENDVVTVKLQQKRGPDEEYTDEVRMLDSSENWIDSEEPVTIELNADNNWEGIFSKLPATVPPELPDDEITEYVPVSYRVVETHVNGKDVDQTKVNIEDVKVPTTAGGTYIYKITNTVEAKKGSIVVNKEVQKDGNLNTEDSTSKFTFGISKTQDGEIITTKELTVSKGKGSVTFDGLDYGTYYVYEMNGTEKVADSYLTYVVEGSGSSKTLSDTNKNAEVNIINNERTIGTINIYKRLYDSDDSRDAGSRATFYVTLKNNNTEKYYYPDNNEKAVVSDDPVEFQINTDSPTTVKDLPLGSYTVEEVVSGEHSANVDNYKLTYEVRDDYSSSNPDVGSVVDQIDLTPGEGQIKDAYVVNKYEKIKVTVKIKKLDENGDGLEGAKFALYTLRASDDDPKATSTTSEENDYCAIFEDLMPSTSYEYKEIEAPEGYILNGERIRFTTVSGGNEDIVQIIEVTNTPVGSAVISIYKQNESSEPLQGAEFTVYTDPSCSTPLKNGDDNVVLVTGEGGIATQNIENIDTNLTYYIKETKAPKNYKTNTTRYKVDITTDGDVTYSVYSPSGMDASVEDKNNDSINDLVVTDELMTGMISCVKRLYSSKAVDSPGIPFYLTLFTEDGTKVEDSTEKIDVLSGYDQDIQGYTGSSIVYWNNIPYGNYAIYETDSEGNILQNSDDNKYRISVDTSEKAGTVTDDGLGIKIELTGEANNASVEAGSIINTEKTTSLKIHKKIIPSSDDVEIPEKVQEEFFFMDVTVDGADGVYDVISDREGYSRPVYFSGEDGATIKVYADETLTIEGLPINADYTLIESENYKSSIVYGDSWNRLGYLEYVSGDVEDGKTGKDEDDIVETTITNKFTPYIPITGFFNLELEKKLSTDWEVKDEFSFTLYNEFHYELANVKNIGSKINFNNIKLSRLFENEYDTEYFTFFVAEDVWDEEDPNLKNYIIDNDLKYVIVKFEKPTDESTNVEGVPFVFDTADEYFDFQEEMDRRLSSAGDEVDYDAIFDEVIGDYASSSATFVNKVKTGDLKLSKVLVSDLAVDADEEFTFTVTLSDNTISGTYGDMTFEDGVATVNLKGGYSATAVRLPVTVEYTVTEVEDSNFELTEKTGDTGTISTTESTAVFTNTRKTGNLEVSKTVTSSTASDKTRDFNFIVTLSDTTINKTYGDTTFEDGKASFTLKDGETKTIDGLPVGVNYSVEEEAVNGFVITKTGDTGTISTTTSKAQFTNLKDEGGLVVNKVVYSPNNDDVQNDSFEFKVELDDKTVNGTYGAMVFMNGVAEFNLMNGESKSAIGLAKGLTYTVSETENEKYTTTYENKTGKIGDKAATCTVTNTRKTGELSVSKEVVSDLAADADRAFTFTVTLSDTTINGTYGGMTFENGVATVNLKGGEKSTASDIPTGITYTVTEASAEGFLLTGKTGDKGTISTTESEAKFTNTRETGDLKLSKELKSYLESDKDMKFAFTITLGDTSINGKYGDMTFVDGVATVNLKHGESATAAELPTSVSYTIVEEDTTGFKLINKVGDTGYISTTTSVAKFTNIRNSVKVSKIDIADGEEIQGATIQILDNVGDVFDEWVSTDKAHEITGLKTGVEYTLKEIVAPEGYTIATEIIFTIDESGKITTTGAVTDDGILLVEDAKTRISVSKVDVADGAELEGATIQIIDNAGKVVEEWVSTDEAHEITGLKTGEEYTLHEIVAPDGYTIASDTKFSIDETGKVTTRGTITEDGVLLVEDAKTKISVSKVDIADGEELEGATIQIIDKDGDVVETWVSTDEAHEITGLKTGEEYTLRETVAPEGYTVATETKFTIGENGNVTSTGTVTEDGVLLVEDAKTRIKVSKVDIADGEELEGAQIQIIDSKGDVVKSWTSGKEAEEIVGLKTGEEYTLRETVAPEGYTIATETTFTIDETGKVTSTGTVTEDGVLLVEDAKTKISVSKVDIADGEEIKGATIQILDKEGKVVEEWVSTDETHEITGLKTGVEYTLKETVAPEGYTIATNTTFSIDENGKVTSTGTVTEDGVLLVEDAKTKVFVSKTDIASGEELAGATIQILDEDGAVVEEWTSDKEPKKIEGLKTGVTYTLIETVAPEGYTIATSTTFSIDENGNVTTAGSSTVDENGDTVLLVEDAKTSISISKVDIANGEELEGATIQIVDENGKVVEEWVSTDKPYIVTGLATGKTYTLKETVSPDGYAITTDTTFKLKEDGTIDSSATTTTVSDDGVLLVEDAMTSVKISKVDVTNDKELPGAVIQILDEDGKIVVDKNGNKLEWTSGDEPKEITGLKTGVKYTLHETVAPEGYQIATDTTFMLDEYGNIDSSETTATQNKDGIILVEDWPQGTVVLNKQGIVNESCSEKANVTEPLADVEFTLKKYLDDSFKSVTVKTDENGIATFTNLDAGTYLITETKTVGYYKLDTNTYYAKIDAKGNYSGLQDKDGNAIEGNLLINELTLADLEFIKVNKSNPEEKLKGSTYGLFKNVDGKRTKIAEATTDADGKISFKGVMLDTEYTVQELIAPNGFYVSENPITISYTLDKEGNVILSKFEDGSGTAYIDEYGNITWLEPQVTVSFNKVDENGNPVSGAKLKVVDANDKEVISFTSQSKAYEVTGIFTAGESYRLIETEAPSGYQLADPVSFKVERTAGADGAETIVVTMTDKKIPDTPKSEDTPKKEDKPSTPDASGSDDKPSTPDTTVTPPTTKTPNIGVDTSDASPIMPIMALMVLAFIAIITIITIKVRRKRYDF